MRFFVQILLAFLFLAGCTSKTVQHNGSHDKTESVTMDYDSLLAQQLNADEYGMRKYVMAFLKTGTNRNQDSATVAKLQREHLDNIIRLADGGKLILAGPFLDGGDLKGIFVFAVATVEEAQALTETDPAVKAGRLAMELHPWYGSAALMQVNALHKKIQKIKI